jgi:hypothetical protein
MLSATDSADLCGPPTCSFCGSVEASRYVGGYGYHVCAECLTDTRMEGSVPAGARCILCALEIGTESAWLQRRTVVAAVCRSGIVLCMQCRSTALEILGAAPTSPASADPA